MTPDQIIYMAIIVIFIVIIYIQHRTIKKLETRINTLAKRTPTSEDERLTYLRENLTHLNKVQAIKALRERYPELSLVDANELWQQSQSKL